MFEMLVRYLCAVQYVEDIEIPISLGWEVGSPGSEMHILESSAMGLVGITKAVDVDREERSEDCSLGHYNL